MERESCWQHLVKPNLLFCLPAQTLLPSSWGCKSFSSSNTWNPNININAPPACNRTPLFLSLSLQTNSLPPPASLTFFSPSPWQTKLYFSDTLLLLQQRLPWKNSVKKDYSNINHATHYRVSNWCFYWKYGICLCCWIPLLKSQHEPSLFSYFLPPPFLFHPSIRWHCQPLPPSNSK